jgi:hypothetical protein
MVDRLFANGQASQYRPAEEAFVSWVLDGDEKAVKETEAALRAAGAEVEAYILDITDEIAVETSFAGVNRRY